MTSFTSTLPGACVEVANFALRYSPEIKRSYQRKLARLRGKAVVALKAVAAKLAKAAYYMLKTTSQLNPGRYK